MFGIADQSSALKTALWSKQIGLEKGEVLCPVCRTNKITQRDFHAGHIVPESKGGPTKIENLMAICAHCNLSMGDTNLFEFREQFREQKGCLVFFRKALISMLKRL